MKTTIKARLVPISTFGLLLAASIGHAAAAPAAIQVPLIRTLGRGTPMVTSYQLVDAGTSAHARLRVNWAYAPGPSSNPDKPDKLFVEDQGTYPNSRLTLIQVSSWQPPLFGVLVGHSPQTLTADLPMTSLFNDSPDFSSTDDGTIEELYTEAAQIAADGMNINDLGPKTVCVQKQTKLSKPYFAMVTCPTK